MYGKKKLLLRQSLNLTLEIEFELLTNVLVKSSMSIRYQGIYAHT